MAVVVKPKAAPQAEIKDGTYRAYLSGVRQFENAYGSRVGFEFTINTGSYSGQKVMRSTAPQLSRKSKLADVLVGLLGRDLTQEELASGLDLEELVGLECQILVISQRSKAGMVYPNVERVFGIG